MDTAVPAGTVFIPFCYTAAPANMLTTPQPRSVRQNPRFKFCAARVTRAEAPAVAAE